MFFGRFLSIGIPSTYILDLCSRFFLFQLLFIGWGLDEEYIEPEEMDYESVKPVKRVLATDKGEEKEDDGKRCLPWGVSCLSDLDMEE